MNIALQDNYLTKFSSVLKDHWERQGHRVQFEPGYNPKLFTDYDRTFVEAADATVGLAMRDRPPKRGKVFVRVIDIDAYVGSTGAIKSDYVDGVIFITKHIQEMCNELYEPMRSCKQFLIPMGLDLDKYAYRGPIDAVKVGFVSTRLTETKGYDILLQLFGRLVRENPSAELHVVGQEYQNLPWRYYIKHLIKVNDLEQHITFHDKYDNIATFWQKMSHMLLWSQKEAFSFVTAEAMAVGVKPIINSWWGAEDTWPEHIICRDPIAAWERLSTPYDPDEAAANRRFVEEHYSLDTHVKAMSEAMEI